MGVTCRESPEFLEYSLLRFSARTVRIYVFKAERLPVIMVA